MGTISINSTELLKSINVVSPVVKDRNSLPILSNLLIEVEKAELKITAYNQEIRSSIGIEVKNKDTFAFCVSKSLLSNILSSLTSVDLELDFNGKNTLKISSKSFEYSLPTEDAKLFPENPNLGDLDSFKVDTEMFLDGLRKSIPFVDTLTENLNRVLIKSKEGKLNIAGISNICFYEKQFDYNGDDVDIVLTTESAKFLIQTIGADSDLSIKYNSAFFCVYFDNISIETLQLAVKAPPYQNILDKLEKKNCLYINREMFLACVKRFAAVSDKDSKFLILEVSKDKMNLSYENDFLKHTAKEIVTDFVYDGEEIKLGLNINKFKTVLTTLEQDVKMYFSASNLPALLEEDNTRILFSPMKV